jgi:hypothetical protein
LGWTQRQYRKTLSILRNRSRVLERLMSEGRWDEIEFDKIPSKAGYKYRNAFARNEYTKERYAAFALDKNTKVNASTMYPYECVNEARISNTNDAVVRAMANKRWENLTNYFNEATFNGIAVVDVSGSMYGWGPEAPINVAISLGLYCADKATGPFANHFITFSGRPQLVQVRGRDFVEKVENMSNADWGYNTNLEAVFNLLLDTAIRTRCNPTDIPKNLLIISDMEIDQANRGPCANAIENQRLKWAAAGYTMPHLVYWNVDARNNTFLDNDPTATYVSGCSPSILQQLLTGKTGYDLMMEVLDSATYEMIG